MTREISGFGKQDWATPQRLFNQWHSEACFTVDLCASWYNTKLPVYVDKERDLFSLHGKLAGQVGWVNPPYEDITAFLEFCFLEAAHGLTSWHLLPANTDTAWFHDFANKGEVHFFRGRIPFDDVTPPEVEAVRLLGRLQKSYKRADLVALTSVCMEIRTQELHRPLLHTCDLIFTKHEADLPLAPWKTRAEVTKSGPGFPSMLVIFDPKAKIGPHPSKTRDAKTGRLL